MRVYDEASLAGTDAASFLREGAKDGGTTVAMSDGGLVSVTAVAGPSEDVAGDEGFAAFADMAETDLDAYDALLAEMRAP